MKGGINLKRVMIKEPVIIHPFEVYELHQLANKLNKSTNTIRNWFDEGLEYRKVGSLTYISGQQFLNFVNKDSSIYKQEQVDKVFNATGIRLVR